MAWGRAQGRSSAMTRWCGKRRLGAGDEQILQLGRSSGSWCDAQAVSSGSARRGSSSLVKEENGMAVEMVELRRPWHSRRPWWWWPDGDHMCRWD
jgi:hypothetical protein